MKYRMGAVVVSLGLGMGLLATEASAIPIIVGVGRAEFRTDMEHVRAFVTARGAALKEAQAVCGRVEIEQVSAWQEKYSVIANRAAPNGPASPSVRIEVTGRFMCN